jgi:hypothetical protein
MRSVLTNLFGCEALGRLLEVASQIMESAQVGARGTFGVITARDFLARYFFELGHRDLLVTQTYRSLIPNAPLTTHAKRLPQGLVQVGISVTDRYLRLN